MRRKNPILLKDLWHFFSRAVILVCVFFVCFILADLVIKLLFAQNNPVGLFERTKFYFENEFNPAPTLVGAIMTALIIASFNFRSSENDD